MISYNTSLSLSDLLNVVNDSGFIHVAANGIISFFLWLSITPLSVHVPHLLYSFLCWWAFRLFPHLGYSEHSTLVLSHHECMCKSPGEFC